MSNSNNIILNCHLWDGTVCEPEVHGDSETAFKRAERYVSGGDYSGVTLSLPVEGQDALVPHFISHKDSQTQVTCPRCDGDGEEPGAPASPFEFMRCSLCDGTGNTSAAHAILYAIESDFEN